jgi:hypothetical protein
MVAMTFIPNFMMIRSDIYKSISAGYTKHTERVEVPNKQTNFVALSPRANYTDEATATYRRNLVPTFVDRGVSHGQRGGSLHGRKSQFSRPEPLLFFQVAPH